MSILDFVLGRGARPKKGNKKDCSHEHKSRQKKKAVPKDDGTTLVTYAWTCVNCWETGEEEQIE